MSEIPLCFPPLRSRRRASEKALVRPRKHGQNLSSPPRAAGGVEKKADRSSKPATARVRGLGGEHNCTLSSSGGQVPPLFRLTDPLTPPHHHHQQAPSPACLPPATSRRPWSGAASPSRARAASPRTPRRRAGPLAARHSPTSTCPDWLTRRRAGGARPSTARTTTSPRTSTAATAARGRSRRISPSSRRARSRYREGE